ncbi:MAG: selenium metabolism-associated LysR family transcriptional regulator [Pseudomonadota bacterium]
MFDLHRLKIFVKIAELKSFSKAALELYLTQPTVSQHISSLEVYFGLPLFDRTGREVTLTGAGEILYRYACQIVTLQKEAEQSLNHFLDKKTGHLIIGASTIPGEYILPELLGLFKKLYPLINITLKIGDTEAIIHSLLDRTIELGVVGARIKDDRLHYSRLCDDELVLIVPQKHPWWNRKEINLRELLEEPFVMRERGSGTRISIEKRLREEGIGPDELRVAAEVGSTTAVKESVRARLGISLVSARAVRSELRYRLLKKVAIKDTAFPRTFYIISDKQRTPSPICSELMQYLQKKQ